MHSFAQRSLAHLDDNDEDALATQSTDHEAVWVLLMAKGKRISDKRFKVSEEVAAICLSLPK